MADQPPKETGLRHWIPRPMRDPVIVSGAVVGMVVTLLALSVITLRSEVDSRNIIQQQRVVLTELAELHERLDRNAARASRTRKAIGRAAFVTRADVRSIIKGLKAEGFDITPANDSQIYFGANAAECKLAPQICKE